MSTTIPMCTVHRVSALCEGGYVGKSLVVKYTPFYAAFLLRDLLETDLFLYFFIG